jgi:hypothetical protein
LSKPDKFRKNSGMSKQDTTFKKGKSGNPSGKPKGIKNAKTKAWEVLGEYLLNDGAKKYKEEVFKLKGVAFLKEYSALLNYFKPRLAQESHKIEQESTITVQFEKNVETWE